MALERTTSLITWAGEQEASKSGGSDVIEVGDADVAQIWLQLVTGGAPTTPGWILIQVRPNAVSQWWSIEKLQPPLLSGPWSPYPIDVPWTATEIQLVYTAPAGNGVTSTLSAWLGLGTA